MHLFSSVYSNSARTRSRLAPAIAGLLLVFLCCGCGASTREETPSSQGGTDSPAEDTSAVSSRASGENIANEPGEDAAADPEAQESVPPDLRVVLGEGGGVTGRWTGRTIAADGTWQQWAGRTAEENPEPGGTIEPEGLRALWTEIVRADFFSLESGEPGNMTRFLRVTANDRTHEVRWSPQMGAAATPTPVQKLYTKSWEITTPGDAD